MIIEFINLTNGLEIIDCIPAIRRFVRIQSTACEQKRWDFIIQDLDHNFLMELALGNKVIVHDYSHDGNSRAIWQGIEWIRYVLSRSWIGLWEDPYVHKVNVSKYFDEQYKNLLSSTLKKIYYYRKFCITDKIKLTGKSGRTIHDGDYEYFKNLILKGKTENGNF